MQQITRGDDWVKVRQNGYDKTTGEEVSVHYWYNTATGEVYRPITWDEWSEEQQLTP